MTTYRAHYETFIDVTAADEIEAEKIALEKLRERVASGDAGIIVYEVDDET